MKQTTPIYGLGIDQTYKTPSRAVDTVYQNTTGKPIFVVVVATTNQASAVMSISVDKVSPPSTTVDRKTVYAGDLNSVKAIVPNGWYYKFSLPSAAINTWVELS